jgi:hypothetical protein
MVLYRTSTPYTKNINNEENPIVTASGLCGDGLFLPHLVHPPMEDLYLSTIFVLICTTV